MAGRYSAESIMILGGWVAIVIGSSHLIGHFLPIPIESTDEAALIGQMTLLEKSILGGQMTMMDIQNGLSLCYSLFFFMLGALAVVIGKRTGSSAIAATANTILMIGFLLGTFISLIYFFWLPVISFLTLSVIFAFAAFKSRKTQSDTTRL